MIESLELMTELIRSINPEWYPLPYFNKHMSQDQIVIYKRGRTGRMMLFACMVVKSNIITVAGSCDHEAKLFDLCNPNSLEDIKEYLLCNRIIQFRR